ncbi:bifunctional hydroxymethylpyrimidine kinase/phosphomethylpyrimidine kinase [Pseudoalteromonas obscura]|uniref:Thiamine-phosphate synthase n=1 Tax=Pseudoalteromonas obscura TaxID=3048491 RepID=A0ABT7EPY8_9GAMM|nr:bifunctional hydroxymethylpyrimidine kinase/phosphomethylpyrimidine kinase [Pseudoalteromonas sp. P94(2023)]MDK2597094.1 bifunctional hydroxymethylpyrimidine kinase/phosphomethylpyrimidine kinase [Pseudoalteromonas sp. P94(2023)]
MSKVVWSIAGSDSGGGAGIQADLKAMHSFGVQGCTAITALTAQNSLGVESLNAVSTDVIEAQLLALESDMKASVIKIGMLANVQQIQLIAEHISRYKQSWETPPTVVYDPVAIATSGDALTEEDTVDALKTHLLPLVDVITPNTHETQLLTGVYLIGPDAVREAAEKLRAFGVQSVVIKGGHWDYPKGYCIDYCWHQDEEYWLGNESINTPHTHGTGCSLSSVIAASLAKGYPLKDAFILGKAYINAGLKSAVRYGEGIGPVAHTAFPHNIVDYPQVIEAGSWLGDELEFYVPDNYNYAAGFAPIEGDLGLYAVVDTIDWVELCLKHDVKTVQLRIKDADSPTLEQDIAKAIELGNTYGGRVFINDHWQLAIKHGAYGVHLGQEDLNVADLNAIKQAGLRLGLSTHGFYEMLRAHNYRPSYLAFGAIYPTTTKDMTGQIQGLEKLRHFVPLMKSEYPTVAIGGIDLGRASEVADTGVGSVAVVRAITEAKSPEQAIVNLKQAIGEP